MMSRITRISFMFLSSGLALAETTLRCALDDCSLPQGMHRLDHEHGDQSTYAWLQHDLAAARVSLRDGDRVGAGALAAATHASLTAQAEHVAEARGQQYVLDLHVALSDVMQRSGRRAPEAPRFPSATLAAR
jgi:hypothetical protein